MTYLMTGLIPVICMILCLTGCASPVTPSHILSQPPYNNVQYVSSPGGAYEVADIIQVIMHGDEADIQHTIPALYKRALEAAKDRQAFIGNIQVSVFTKKEPVQVPFLYCYPDVEYVPVADGVDSSGRPTYSLEPRTREKCEIRYREEIRDVLYQKATADLLRPKEENP